MGVESAETWNYGHSVHTSCHIRSTSGRMYYANGLVILNRHNDLVLHRFSLPIWIQPNLIRAQKGWGNNLSCKDRSYSPAISRARWSCSFLSLYNIHSCLTTNTSLMLDLRFSNPILHLECRNRVHRLLPSRIPLGGLVDRVIFI